MPFVSTPSSLQSRRLFVCKMQPMQAPQAALRHAPSPPLGLRLAAAFRPAAGRAPPCRVGHVEAVAGRPRAARPPRPAPEKRPAPAEPGNSPDGPRKNKLDIWKRQLARLPANPRAVAVVQLLRIEEEGAFVGLVGGSPGKAGSTDTQDDEEGSMLPGRNWREKLDDRDARFVTEVVAGVTRWRRRLDHTIGQLTKGDIESLDAPLRQILRLGLYELMEMGAPSHTVNEHVQLAKRVMNTGAGGFANGVLRNAARAIEAHHLPPPPQPAPNADLPVVADALGVASSHPTWLVERWLRQLGPHQTLSLLKWNNARPHHSLRLSPGLDASPTQLCAQLAKTGVVAMPSRYLPYEFVRVDSGLQALLASSMLAEGWVQVQDEAAGMVVAMLDPRPGETLLDACAAPGGKTLFAAARMGGKGRILAVDISAPRLQALASAAQRQGYGSMVATLAADLTQLAPAAAQQQQQQQGPATGGSGRLPAAAPASPVLQHPSKLRARVPSSPPGTAAAAAARLGSEAASAQAGPAGGQAPSAPSLLQQQFDRVLLDAPCSGTGVLAKRADLRWRRTPGSLRQLTGLQSALLAAAAARVKPGGLLVYSTCSIEAEENGERVAAFLAAHPDFAPEPPPAAAGIPPECLTPEGYLQMLPHVHDTDGAFAARLRRRVA